MKLFYFILLIFATESMANTSKLLKCLGAEEARIHKQQIQGAFYELNKSMISFVVQFQDTTLFKEKYMNEVCQEQFSSFHLLRLFLIHNAFILKKSSKVIPGLAASSPENIAKNALHMLLSFLSRYQASFSNPHCLKEKIPELKDFLYRTKHLETDINYQKLVNDLPNIGLIMDKILSQQLKQEC